MSLAINSVSHQSPNFGKSAKIEEAGAQAATKKMSTTSKVMMGLGAIATAAIATIAVKNKMAANAAKKAAQEIGVDVDLYKALKGMGVEIKKTETADYDECLDWIRSKVDILGKDKAADASCLFIPSNLAQESFKPVVEKANFPENSFIMSLYEGDVNRAMQLVIPQTTFQSEKFADTIGKSFAEGRSHVINITE